ncbi:GTP cyclohydrolase II [Coniosporium apollinis]|uniref:GTP cyclohydrolase II n=2 Tax=Coniosporium TaxID=2810619 RepID=A0ABQ9NNJ7_9PEZI|nr:GTP cyclohydrolase II [Coniosporium apollinis]
MPDLPAHASPALPPIFTPEIQTPMRIPSELNLNRMHDHAQPQPIRSRKPLPPLITPAITPPNTPSRGQDDQLRLHSLPVYDSGVSTPSQAALVESLPIVECVVRARIPTTTGQEMFLHLYTNDVDNKEHLAIVFGSNIRSRSLDAPRPGESERDRMIRGAYVGRLHPGRTSSRLEQLRREEGGGPTSAPRQINEPSSSSNSSVDGADESTDPDEPQPPLVRIHSECYTGETVWSARCDCGEQLDEAARLMQVSGGGVIVYLRQEGRGIGLAEKLKAYNLQDLGNDTYEANLLLRHPADARSYGLATSILVDLGMGGQRGIRLLTNNPDKVRAVEGPNREIVVRERVPMVPLAWQGKRGVNSEEVDKYLSTKVGLQSVGVHTWDDS